MAMAIWPTRTSAERPSSACGSFSPETRITARSVSASSPIRWAEIPSVSQDGAEGFSARDHVAVGQKVAIGRVDPTRAHSQRAAVRVGHDDADDRRSDALEGARDGCGIGIEEIESVGGGGHGRELGAGGTAGNPGQMTGALPVIWPVSARGVQKPNLDPSQPGSDHEHS